MFYDWRTCEGSFPQDWGAGLWQKDSSWFIKPTGGFS